MKRVFDEGYEYYMQLWNRKSIYVDIHSIESAIISDPLGSALALLSNESLGVLMVKSWLYISARSRD